MITDLFIFTIALYLVVKGSTMAATYASRLATSLRLSTYAVGFTIVAIISILPEALIAINSAVNGVPSFGLSVLFGSNVADLTLVFAILVFYAGKGLKVESKILKNHVVYPFVLLLPLILGLDGHFSRLEGVALVVAGVAFYYVASRRGAKATAVPHTSRHDRHVSLLMLFVSMAVLLTGAHFTVTSATSLAHSLAVSPILIGMLVVGLGTTMPELFFSLKSIQKRDDSLAFGDLLGTVLADATIVVGILALVSPFAFPQEIIYITGGFMLVASCILFHVMRTGRVVTRREASVLLAFWILFVVVEFMANM